MDISFTGSSKTAGLDGMLTNLTDRGREASTDYQGGERVRCFTQNGLVAPSDLPLEGAEGVVVTLRSASGDITSLGGEVFVRWDKRDKIEKVPAAFLRKTGKVASSPVIEMGNSSLLEGGYLNLIASSERNSDLIYKSPEDIWSVKLGEDGSFDIERLHSDDDGPIQF